MSPGRVVDLGEPYNVGIPGLRSLLPGPSRTQAEGPFWTQRRGESLL